MLVHSIRYALMLWYVGVLTVVLCLFGWILYASLHANLMEEVSKTLSLQAIRIADTIAASWSAERATPGSGPGNWAGSPADTLESLVASGGLPGLIDRWGAKTGWLTTDHLIRILDRTGQPIAESAAFNTIPVSLTAASVGQGKEGHPAYQTFTIKAERFQLITYPAIRSQRILYLVQTAVSLQQADAALARLRWRLFWLVPFLILVTSVVGHLLTNRVLRPINQMIAHAQHIAAERLERLEVPQTGDELEHLAVTFNHMLERIELGFKRLRQFSAAASHELRTPLTVMKGELEVTLRKPRSEEEYREVLQTHLGTVNELAAVVEELLTLARGEAAAHAVDWRPLELGTLVQQVSELWRKPADAKQVRLDIVNGAPVWVHGERRLLERLVSNLLDNAVRYTPAHGQIRVTVGQRDHQASIVVRDTGPGISPEQLPTLFDRFFRLPPPNPEDQRSTTGLGLGLCRWIAEVHRGWIDVDSQPQSGTSFTVWLPRIATPA
jgi:heavy metal sensor kinase